VALTTLGEKKEKIKGDGKEMATNILRVYKF